MTLLNKFFIFIIIMFSCMYGYEKYKNYKKEQKIFELQSKNEILIKQSDTLYLSSFNEISNIKNNLREANLNNKDLIDKIKKQNNKIISLTQLTLQLKDQAIKFQKPIQTIENQNNVIREKVTFVQEQNNLKIEGFTLTNPAEAQLSLSYVKPIELNVILSQDKHRQYYVYIDTSTNLIPTKINMSFDLQKEFWYQKISFDTGIAVDKNFNNYLSYVSIKYDIKSINIGPALFATLGKNSPNLYYGIGIGWFPWK